MTTHPKHHQPHPYAPHHSQDPDPSSRPLGNPRTDPGVQVPYADPGAAAEEALQPVPRLLLTIPQAAQALAIGRSSLYLLLQRGDLASVTIGGSRRVTTHALTEYINRLSNELDSPSAPVPSGVLRPGW